MNHPHLLKRLAGTGLAVMLLAAACTPSNDLSTPLATEADLNTPAVSSPVPTIETTLAATDMATAESTAMVTAESTEAVTAEATALATEPATTGTPNAVEQPAVLLSSELVGSHIVDSAGAEVGEVKEVLIDSQGVVQYVIFDASDYLAEAATEATPVATGPAMEEGVLAVPMTDFMVNAKTDDKEAVLEYTGTADDLRSLGAFDAALLDGDGFLVDSTKSGVAADMTYDGLIRMSKIADFDLKNTTGDELGEVKDMIVDVPNAKVSYGVVDFGGFLGLAEQTTVVPWSLFTVQQTGDKPNFLLEVTSDTLKNAPTLDLGDWPDWPERIQSNSDWTMDWDNQIRTFWDGAASS